MKVINNISVQEYTRFSDIKRLRFIIDTLKRKVPGGSKILDVGCGNGIISNNLGKEKYNVLGIDISEKSIETAKRSNALSNVNFKVVNAEKLSLGEANYDAIICSEVLEHLDNPSSLLEELYKSLKSEGVLIVTVPNGKGPRESLVTKPLLAYREKNNWQWRMVLKAKKILGYQGTTIQSDAEDLDHVQFFTRNDLNELAENNQFKILDFKSANFIDDVFPFSWFSNRLFFLQKLDCKIADILPNNFSGGFMMSWVKK